MSCNDCNHRLTYLHKIGVVDDELFNKIIAGHPNKSFHDVIKSLQPSATMYCSTFFIPKKLSSTWIVE